MRSARVLAWTLWAAFVVTLATAAYFGLHPPVGPGIQLMDAIWAASFIGFPTAGALIAPRLPRRPLGWILLVAPLLIMLGVALSDLAAFPLHSGNVVVAAWLLWVSTVVFAAGLGALLVVPLYLPDGSLPSPRWHGVGKGLWAVVGVWILHATFKPGPLEAGETAAAASGPLHNPLGLEPLRAIFGIVEALLGPLAFGAMAVGVLSLIIRSRRARGVERQQLKWLALGGAGIFVCFGSIALIEAFIRDLGDAEVTVFIVLAILSLPASIAVAVLKTRLYEIDVILNRTLVYGTLTAVLATSYFGIVVLLQRVLEPLTRESDLAVAGSTLAVAALARPALARVQSFIDRRFYRRKYDAAETLGAFSARLRDQVDLESLRQELVAVVGATMQPEHASLWLRHPERAR
ncbi:MAG: hypothetical protein M3N53_12110 [Actinomycetota bacterium]|nr:hypothetical protein [Actinomycetota bacterium]